MRRAGQGQETLHPEARPQAVPDTEDGSGQLWPRPAPPTGKAVVRQRLLSHMGIASSCGRGLDLGLSKPTSGERLYANRAH